MSAQPQRWRLPPAHQELLRNALRAGGTGTTVTPEQRMVLRQLCSAPERTSFEPENLLIAFKLALVDAANDVGIPPGPERNDFLARLVSVYIEEFYRFPVADEASKKAVGQDLAGGRELAGGQEPAGGQELANN